MGAQWLRDRLRVAARAVRAVGRATQPRARVPRRRAGLHPRLGRVRAGDERRGARRVPRRPGGGRRPAHARVPEPRPRHRARRAPPLVRPRVDRGRRPGRGARSRGRRPARRRRLAVGLPRERSDRPGRAVGRVAAAAARVWPSRAAAGRARRRAAERRRRGTHARAGARRRLGLGLDRDAGDARHLGGAALRLRRSTACAPATRSWSPRSSVPAASRAPRSS